MRREIENVIEVKQLSKKLGSFTLGEMSFELPMGYIIGLIGEKTVRAKRRCFICFWDYISRTQDR